MNFSTRDRRAILFGFFTLLIILAAHFVLFPRIDDWSANRRRISSCTRELRNLKVDISRVLGQRRRLERTFGPAAVQPLEDVQTAGINLLQAAQDAFAASGFKANEYRLQNARALPDLPGVQFVPLEVPGECDLPKLLKLLSALPKAKTLIFLEDLKISNEDKSGKLKVTVTLATLALTPKADS